MATRKQSKLKTFLEVNFTEFSQPESERLKALYADFSKLWVLNEYAFERNADYWRRVILDSSQQGLLGSSDYTLVINREALPEKFQRPILGRPLALDCVLDVMEKKNEVMALEDFNKTFAPPLTWLGWMIDTVVKNAWQWRWRLSAANDAPSKYYVVLPTLRAIARAILLEQQQIQQQQHYNSSTNSSSTLLTLTEFRQHYAHHFVNEIDLTDEDIHLLLRYLHSQHGVAIADQVKGYNATYTVIKFPEADAIAASLSTTAAHNNNKVQPAKITKHDEAIISIRTTCYALSVQVDTLQKKSEELTKQAITEKNLGHKSKALYCLRRRKNLQEILDRRLQSMETMDTVLLKIEQAKDDLQIVQALNMGADTLKGLLGKDGLSVVSIDEVMSKIQDTLDDQKEIENIMQMGMDDMNDSLMADINEEEVADDLSDLIRQEEKENLTPTHQTTSTIPAPLQHQQHTTYGSSSPALSTSNIPSSHYPDPKPEESELARLNNLFSNMDQPANKQTNNGKRKEKEPVLA